MSAPENIKMKDRLRARDGGLCWLCQKPINFNAEPDSARSASVEHLIPRCRQGPNTMENLVLCHPDCNKLLNDRPLAEKIEMREEHLLARWKADMRKRIAARLME